MGNKPVVMIRSLRRDQKEHHYSSGQFIVILRAVVQPHGTFNVIYSYQHL